MNIFQRALNRISEPSTWAGIGGLSVLAGLPPGAINTTAQILAGIASLFAIVSPESQFDKPRPAPAPVPPAPPMPTPIAQTSGFVVGPSGAYHQVQGPFVIGPTGLAHPVAPAPASPFVIGGTRRGDVPAVAAPAVADPVHPAPAPAAAPAAGGSRFVVGGTARP